MEAENSQLKCEIETLNEMIEESTPAHVYESKEKIRRLEQYEEKLKSIYCSIDLPDATFDYASVCFDNPFDLDLFDPIKYLKNPWYRKVIDFNVW